MPYFENFPVVSYPVTGTKIRTNLRDITRRVILNKNLRNSLHHYYYYQVRNGEKPEHVAYNLYGSSEYHWIILLMNTIENPWFDWPLSESEFDNMMANKYPHHSLLFTHNTLVVNYGSGGACNGDFNTINVATQFNTGANAVPVFHDNANSKIYISTTNGSFNLTDTIQQYNDGIYVGITAPFTISFQGGFTINTDPLCNTRVYQKETGANGKAMLYDSNLQKLVVNVETGTFSTDYPIREVNGESNIDAVLFSTVLNTDAVHHYENEDAEEVTRGYRPLSYTIDGTVYDKGTTELRTATARGSKGPITNEEYERNLNEDRITIKVLKPEFVEKAESELKKAWNF